MREAGEAEVVALVRQRVGDLGPPARPHQEHYLVVAVVLREWTLSGRHLSNDAAERPDVGGAAVARRLHEHLGGHVRLCADEAL